MACSGDALITPARTGAAQDRGDLANRQNGLRIGDHQRCGGQIRSLVPDVPNARGDEPVGLPTQRGISSFGEDAKGNLYFTNLYSGGVYEIVSGR